MKMFKMIGLAAIAAVAVAVGVATGYAGQSSAAG